MRVPANTGPVQGMALRKSMYRSRHCSNVYAASKSPSRRAMGRRSISRYDGRTLVGIQGVRTLCISASRKCGCPLLAEQPFEHRKIAATPVGRVELAETIEAASFSTGFAGGGDA